jgi:hypothetical protein
MGGEVWYERRFPTGARFCYSLPLRRRTVVGEGDMPEEIDLDATAAVELDDEIVLSG